MAIPEYIPTVWIDDSIPAINARNLNHIEEALKKVTDALIDVPIIRDVPIGTIVAFNGDISDLPAAWSVCNGTNNTPDLRDRFIMGEGINTGVTGGDKDAVVVEHTHRLRTRPENLSIDDTGRDILYASAGYSDAGLMESTGVDGTDKNLPPYYKLVYIMRVS